MSGLVLSLFPGIGLLDMAFEAEGFCCVRGPDVIWGGDVREFHPPPGVFRLVIGGPPCQSFSALANLVRAKGLEPKFGNLIPEFSRVVEATRPEAFVMENVPKAPDPEPAGYTVTSFLLDNCWLGEVQMRKRRIWFGWREEYGPAPNLRRWIPGVALKAMESTQAVAADCRAVPVRHGGSGKVKVTADGGHDGHSDQLGAYKRAKQAPVTGRHEGAVGAVGKDYSPPRRTLGEMLELQGFPADMLDECPLTMQGKRKAVGNGVPLPMGRAVARAVLAALAPRPQPEANR